MLFAVCRDTNRRHFNNRWLPAPVPNEPETPQLALPPPTCAAADPAAAAADPATAAPKTCAPAPARAARTSSCFAGAGPGGTKTAAGGGGDAPPLALVGSHASGAVFPTFGEYVYVLWHRVCAYCGLVCRERAEGAPYVLGDGVDLLLDPHWSLPLDNPTLEKIPHRFVFYSWDPGKLGRYFHFNGNLLETVGPTEGIHAQAKQRTESSLNIRVNQEMRSGGGFIYSWRRALTHVGLSKAAIAKVLDQEIAKLEANWTRDLVNHMSAYKSG